MSKVVELLRDKACYYLDHTCETIDKSLIHVPSPDTIDKVWIDSDRNIKVLNSLQTLLGHGRLANTGYVSILPVDQDIVQMPERIYLPGFFQQAVLYHDVHAAVDAVIQFFAVAG